MRTRPLRRALSGVLPCLALLTACPSEVEKGHVAADAGKTAEVSPDDERVVKVGGDLYAKDAPSNPAEVPDDVSPGTGKPDETNGVCRLYAPKLQDPACCKFETGFDAEAAKRICGHALYLGESIRMSCGYFFSDEALTAHPSFRASLTTGTDPKRVADAEAEQLNFQLRKRDIKPEPIDGIKGAYLVRNDKYRWAFLPGWTHVRKISWSKQSCSDEKMPELLKVIVAAKQAGSADQRPMIPSARSQ